MENNDSEIILGIVCSKGYSGKNLNELRNHIPIGCCDENGKFKKYIEKKTYKIYNAYGNKEIYLGDIYFEKSENEKYIHSLILLNDLRNHIEYHTNARNKSDCKYCSGFNTLNTILSCYKYGDFMHYFMGNMLNEILNKFKNIKIHDFVYDNHEVISGNSFGTSRDIFITFKRFLSDDYKSDEWYDEIIIEIIDYNTQKRVYKKTIKIEKNEIPEISDMIIDYIMENEDSWMLKFNAKYWKTIEEVLKEINEYK